MAAVELQEMPKNYAFQDNAAQPQEDMVPKFLSVARHLSLASVPFSLRFERRDNVTRVLFLTWAQDDTLLYHQKTVLQDTLEGNLHGFRFKTCGYYEGLELGNTQSAAAVEVSGIPLSIEDEGQRKDPMDVVAGILQGLENGLVQIFVQPVETSDSELSSLESQFRQAVESSETTVTKEKSGLFSSDRQESKRIVDPKAMRRAELLKRQLERVSGKNLCKTQVMAASWGKRLEDADLAARRLSGGLMGALRPDMEQEGFKVRFYRNQKDVAKLLKGLPIGSYSILTPSEATNYLVLPKTDLGVRVTSRERFSSGTKEAADRPAAQAIKDAFECHVRTSVKWKRRRQKIIYGHPLSESGQPIETSYIISDIRYYDGHLIILGTTRSGKTFTAISIMGQAIAQGVNPIILIPSKAYEWRVLIVLFPDLHVFTAGDSDIALLMFNFWDPPPNVRLSKWVDRVVQVLTLWLPNDSVISMHVEDWVYTIYRICGWDIKTGKKGRPIMFEDIVEGLIEFGKDLNYDDERNRTFYGILYHRVKSILRKPALVEMFNTRVGITIPELLAHPTIIEMDNLSQNDRVLLMGMLTAAISEYKLANPSKAIENLLVLEEAHYILGKTNLKGEANSSARGEAIAAIIEMLRVLGGTGLGMVILDQLPSSLVDEVVKLAVNVILHRLKEDKQTMEMLGSHVGCTDAQFQHIRGMQRGETVVYLEREGEPKNVRILPLSHYLVDKLREDNPSDSEVKEHMTPFYQEHPELSEAMPLPDNLMERLKQGFRPQETGEEKKTGIIDLNEYLANGEFVRFAKSLLDEGTERGLQRLAEFIYDEVGEAGRVPAIRLAGRVMEEIAPEDKDAVAKSIVSRVLEFFE